MARTVCPDCGWPPIHPGRGQSVSVELKNTLIADPRTATRPLLYTHPPRYSTGGIGRGPLP